MIQVVYTHRDGENHKAHGDIHCAGTLRDDPDAAPRMLELIESGDLYDIDDPGAGWMEHPVWVRPSFECLGLSWASCGGTNQPLMEWTDTEEVEMIEETDTRPGDLNPGP